MRPTVITDADGRTVGYVKFARFFDHSETYVGHVSGSDILTTDGKRVGRIGCMCIRDHNDTIVGYVHGHNIYNTDNILMGRCKYSTLIAGGALLLLLSHHAQ